MERTPEEKRQEEIAEKFAKLAITMAIQDTYESRMIIIQGERIEDD